MDLLKFPGVPEAGGLRMCLKSGIDPGIKDRTGGSLNQHKGFPGSKGNPSHLCPALGSVFPSPTCEKSIGAVVSPPADLGILCAAGTHKNGSSGEK